MATEKPLAVLASQIRGLATDPKNVSMNVSRAAVLVRKAIDLGAFSDPQFAVFVDLFDKRYDAKPGFRLWMALRQGVIWLAENPKYLGDDPPEFCRDGFERHGCFNFNWARVNLPIVADLLESQISLAIVPRGTKEQKKTAKARAMILKLENPELADTEIAGKVGLHPSTLTRDAAYQKIAIEAEKLNEGGPKGFVKKSPESGRSVEAIDDEHDPADMDFAE